MNKLITSVIFTFFSLALFAQDAVTEELKALSKADAYNKIISDYAGKSENYSAKSLYYIGLAYYMKEDDSNCIRFMDLSLAKDSKDAAPHYIKGATLNYMKKYEEAVTCFESAITLKGDDVRSYSGLGDAYYNLGKENKALEAYTNATLLKDCPYLPYSMIGQIYSAKKNNEKALQAFYIAKSKIDNTSSSYTNILFNIGLSESLMGNYDKAEPAFVELLKMDPSDYHSYAKLIQIYYHRKEYDKAKPYKDKLYEAHKKNQLTGNMKDMFCFDQFQWNDKSIQVFERYEEGSKDIYNKHLFFVVDKDDNVLLKVQTEYSPVSLELGGPKYLLCATKGDTHYNPGIGFNDDFKYDDLKSQVIKLVEKHM